MTWSRPPMGEDHPKRSFSLARLHARLHLRRATAREQRRGEPELALLRILVDPARIALDVGANKGIWSEVLRRCCREVHAFEPNPRIYQKLERGAGKGVRPHSFALSNITGTAELRVPRRVDGNYSNQGASLSTIKVPDDQDYRSIMAQTRRLDDLGFADIGFIKIDVEGHELAVIAGAMDTLRRDRPNLIVEMEERHTQRPIADMLAQICDLGYEAYALRRGLLCRASRIDLVRHHTQALVGHPDYIFNWIFLPT
ncbi:MAG: hypothetical protein QOD93_1844 [Acetobacteraceae bacterium]|jgi:FkbM family methyltransferase|nr:hypothetical protein [Acetobacteraceae bacterium]